MTFILRASYESGDLDRRLEFVSKMSYNASEFGAYEVEPWYLDDITFLDMSFAPGFEKTICEYILYEKLKGSSISYSVTFESGGDPGYIYIMEAVGSQPTRYKIGLSYNPKQRNKQLNGGQSPYPVEIVHTSETSNMAKAEDFLKTAYAQLRRHGEWFELTERDVEVIKNIQFV